VIGLDFDNTIVCYDEVFARVAAEEGLVPEGVAPTKSRIRDHLRRAGREEAWTELQGRVYGPLMRYATPFPGALEFIAEAVRGGYDVAIVSHRTRYPYRGERHDLHAAARAWLTRYGCGDGGSVGLADARIHFEETKDAKLKTIGLLGCRSFVDDLPEIVCSKDFPPGVDRILFDPAGTTDPSASFVIARSWSEVRHSLLTSVPR
jgi:hypothetical protein